ncbi:MAG: YcfL family protein [Phycisphaerales bacterium]|nr:YcfL family protein [Phycisphaerales bacterium]
MIKHTATVISLASALLFAGACGSVNTVSTRTTPANDQVDDLKLQINDLLTSIFLKCRDVRVFRTPGGSLEAQVDVANDDFRQRNFAYKFTWMDARGNMIHSSMSVWKPASVASGASITISSIAPTSAATDFTLQVRRSN